MSVRILTGDCRDELKTLADRSVHCVVTSPPYYGLRDYNVSGQIGLEDTPQAYVDEMVAVFREVHRVLRDDGTLWLNLGDSYANDTKWGCKSSGKHVTALHGDSGIGRRRQQTGFKSKDLMGIPWMVAFALRADGWYLRQDIIWSKPNPMPESVTDRCTKAHEYLFMLSKSARYFYDADAIRQPATEALLRQIADGYEGQDTKDFGLSRAQSASGTKARIINGARAKIDKQRGHSRRHAGFNGRWDNLSREEQIAVGSNKRSVWTVATQPFSEAHFATFPPALIEPCILAGCPAGGTVLDPFLGAGTTAMVADRLGRSCVGIELNLEYAAIAERRLHNDAGMFSDTALA